MWWLPRFFYKLMNWHIHVSGRLCFRDDCEFARDGASTCEIVCKNRDFPGNLGGCTQVKTRSFRMRLLFYQGRCFKTTYFCGPPRSQGGGDLRRPNDPTLRRVDVKYFEILVGP